MLCKDLVAWLSTRRCLICVALIAAVTGCSRSNLDVAPVHGKVTIDGKSLFQGKVMFAPVAKGDSVHPGKPAWGNIQPDGTFRLTTLKQDDGAIVGEHWVTIINSDEKLPAGVPFFARLIVPKKATIVAGTDNEINFAFAGTEIRKFSEDNH